MRFKVGDVVHWTNIKGSVAAPISMKHMKCEIVAINEIALVKTENGKCKVPLVALRLPDETSALTSYLGLPF
mgnify:CR=1 FL=1